VSDRAVVRDARAGHDRVVEVGGERAALPSAEPSPVAVIRVTRLTTILSVQPDEDRPGICEGTLRPAPHLGVADPHDLAGTEPSTLPPVSAARSTTTEPGFICSTIARSPASAPAPGTAAVVISASAARCTASAAHAAGPPVLGHLARVAAAPLEGLQLEVDRLGAHRPDLLGGGRADVVARTTAPSRLAVAMAWRPGDAGAEHDDLGGWTVPAAVMLSGKKRRSMPAATIAQR
jgi:hypothetical protein